MYAIGCKYNMDHGCVNLFTRGCNEFCMNSILYYPFDLDEDHTKEKIIQKLVDHI
jgi:hypothetical protein